MLNVSHKDKSVILLISVALIIIWTIISVFSSFYNKASFKSAEINKLFINSSKNKWFNVRDSLKLEDLKQKIIFVNFWNYSCLTCATEIEKIKDIEAKYPNLVTIISIHSPIFENEKNYNSIKKAIIRHNINFPVLNDENREISEIFKIDQNPTFLIFGLDGKIHKKFVGAKSIDSAISFLEKTIKKNKYSINLEPLPIVLEKNPSISSILTNPAKIKYVENFKYKKQNYNVLITANSGQNSIIISQLNGTILATIGGRKSGFVDGKISEAKFSHPQSTLYDGNYLFIADTGNNSLRMVDFNKDEVSTLIGDGSQGEVINNKQNDAKTINLYTPTDIEFFPDKSNIAISNAGTNQILIYNIPNKTVSIIAGNGDNGNDEGIYPENNFAQTNDMAIYENELYLVDGLSSSIRKLNKDGKLTNLYKSTSDNNTNNLQNPSALYVDESGIYIADSFNNQIKKFDNINKKLSNIAGNSRGDDVGFKTSFDEPAGLVAILDKLYVADTNNDRILIVNRANGDSSLYDILPSKKISKETFVEYLPNLQKSEEITVKSLTEIGIKIAIKDGFKINENAPSFINLLKLKNENTASLIASFDWDAILNKRLDFRNLENDQEYLLQGKIYFCKNAVNSLCFIKSYEQKIIAKSIATDTQIIIDVGK